MGQADQAADRMQPEASDTFNPQDVVRALCSRKKVSQGEAYRALCSGSHQDLLDELSTEQLRVLELHYIENFGLAEIANAMRISDSAVGTLLREARLKLRQAVGLDNAEGDTDDEREAA